MTQALESASFDRELPAVRDWQGWLQIALLGLLVVALYSRVLGALVRQWAQDPNYSHGFVVPIFCAWIVWRQRKRIAAAPVKPSWAGLIVIAGSLTLFILGLLGAELFLARTSLLFLIAGLAIQFRGWRFFREILFPWAVLFLMIPLPAIVFNEIALPLQFQASRLASAMLDLAGVPVLREGNVIHLPSITLDVAEACSGLRSLVSLVTLAIMYGYLTETRIWRRVVLVLMAPPIAVFANGVRIMGSGILGQYWDRDKAEGFFHMFSGLLVFLVSVGLVVVLQVILSRFGRKTIARHV